MKKVKKIKLTSEEEIEFDSLTEREKMIFEAGEDSGRNIAANRVLIMGLVAIVTVVLTNCFLI